MRQQAQALRRDDAGFTLIELVVVMAIMSVLLGLSATGWERYKANQEDGSAAAAVVSVLRNAQVRATSEATSYRVDVDAAGRTLTVLRFDGTANYIVQRTQRLEGKNVRIESVSFTHTFANPASAYFSARGTASPGSIVIKRADHNRKHTIKVEGLTGRVSTQ